MKKSLFNIYESVCNHPRRWRYYNSSQKLNIDNVLDSESSKSFIYDYFNIGNKSEVMLGMTITEKMRYNHIISCFLLGIHLKNVFIIRNIKPNFKYLWFVTCLFHDFGYDFEKEENQIPDIEHDLMKVYKIPKSLYPIIKNDTINKYNQYRNNRDHGIIGGKLLYDKLVKNYYYVKGENRINPEVDDFVIDQTRICFKKSDFTYYAKAATAVILHNIWLCNKNQENEYREFGLESLICKKYKFAPDTSFLLLFLITDTLEPIKRIKKLTKDNIESLIKNIFIEIDRNKITISCNTEFDFSDFFDSKKWIKEIGQLDSWLDIELQPDPDDLLKTTIIITK